jgi:hypothetical protein
VQCLWWCISKIDNRGTIEGGLFVARRRAFSLSFVGVNFETTLHGVIANTIDRKSPANL